MREILLSEGVRSFSRALMAFSDSSTPDKSKINPFSSLRVLGMRHELTCLSDAVRVDGVLVPDVIMPGGKLGGDAKVSR